ncbi:MAG TPA: cupin domain-containing protein [Acidimicrobiia bacterium]
MEHTPVSALQRTRQPEEHFTGKAWMETLSQGDDRVLNAISVTFEAGARTHWHSHPEGQVLYVVSGNGRGGTEAGEFFEFATGDVLYSKPDELHWHGASPDSPMSHLSLTTGGATQWKPRPVSDEEYENSPPGG